jgi:hypothetical protein
MKYIISEQQYNLITESNLNVRRRLKYVDDVLNHVLSKSEPCYFDNEESYLEAVLLSLSYAIMYFDNGGADSESILDFIKEYKKDYIFQYFFGKTKDC